MVRMCPSYITRFWTNIRFGDRFKSNIEPCPMAYHCVSLPYVSLCFLFHSVSRAANKHSKTHVVHNAKVFGCHVIHSVYPPDGTQSNLKTSVSHKSFSHSCHFVLGERGGGEASKRKRQREKMDWEMKYFKPSRDSEGHVPKLSTWHQTTWLNSDPFSHVGWKPCFIRITLVHEISWEQLESLWKYYSQSMTALILCFLGLR